MYSNKSIKDFLPNKSGNFSNTRENELDQQNTSVSLFSQGINNTTSTESTSEMFPNTSRYQLFRKFNEESFNLDKETSFNYSDLSDSFKYSLNLRDQSSKLLNLREGNHSSCSQFSPYLPFGRSYKKQYSSSSSSHDESHTSKKIQNINDSVYNSLFQELNGSSHSNSDHFSSLVESPIPFSPHPREFLSPVSFRPYKETVKSQNEIPFSYDYSQEPLEREQWLNESPLTQWYQQSPIRRQRPIIGRKLMTKTDNVEFDPTIWSFEPEIKKEPFYELFPSENDKFKAQNVSPTPTMFSNISPTANMNEFTTTLYNENSLIKSLPNDRLCTLCRKNGETPAVYLTHYLKEKIGNKKIVTCPILRALVCTICGVSGDKAHTITYCPVLRNSNNGQPLQSTTLTLKNTRMQSNGRRRF